MNDCRDRASQLGSKLMAAGAPIGPDAAGEEEVECEPLGGPGAACIVCTGSCQATGNTFCIAAAA